MWMLRGVAAPAAIAARGFAPGVSVSVPLAVHDQARPANAGRWRLTVADGKGALVSDGAVSKAGAVGKAGAVSKAGAAGRSGGAPVPVTVGARGLAALYG